MKKAFLAVALVLGMSIPSFAQNGLSVRLGGSFPVGTFAQGEDFTDIALSGANKVAGGAATGFNAGVKYQLGVLGGLNVFASADLFYNGLNGDIKEEVKTDAVEIKLPSYVNIPVMAGVNYEIIDVLGATLWAEAGVGVNLRNITKSSTSASINSIDISGSSESSYNMSASLAYQAGVGVTLANTVSLGVHYYAFGGSEIKGENVTEGGLGGIAGEMKNDLTAGKLNPSMVVVRLGYTF